MSITKSQGTKVW